MLRVRGVEGSGFGVFRVQGFGHTVGNIISLVTIQPLNPRALNT